MKGPHILNRLRHVAAIIVYILTQSGILWRRLVLTLLDGPFPKVPIFALTTSPTERFIEPQGNGEFTWGQVKGRHWWWFHWLGEGMAASYCRFFHLAHWECRVAFSVLHHIWWALLRGAGCLWNVNCPEWTSKHTWIPSYSLDLGIRRSSSHWATIPFPSCVRFSRSQWSQDELLEC